MYIRNYAGLFILLAMLVSACSDSGTPAPQPPRDAEAIAANNHAVGLMGQFEFTEAQALFADLATQWPGWHDIKVNQAIATLNRQQDGDEMMALDLALEVLQAEPSNARAQYVAGLMQLYLGRPADARKHFEYVVEADPKDAHAAYYLAQCLAQLGDYGQALPGYERSMELDPYLRSAYYGAFQSLQRLGRPEQAKALATDYQRLENNPRSHLAEFKYTRMGQKAEALAIDLAAEPPPPRPGGALFAEPVSLPITNASSLDWRSLPAERTPSITTVDMEGDDWPDLFVAGAVGIGTINGETATGNLVLKGQAGGGYAALLDHPLTAVSQVNAALWGDFDNDGLVDVYLCRRGKNQLWRQTVKNSWEDVTASTLTAGAELDTVDGAFFDADHDGDLDLFLINADGPNELLNNNLNGTFKPLAEEYGLGGSGAGSVMVVPADLDNDRDADLIVLSRTPPHQVYANDRLWSYHPAAGYEQFNNTPALAVLAADIDVDGLVELYTLSPEGTVLVWRAGPDGQVQSQSLAAPEILKEAATGTTGNF